MAARTAARTWTAASGDLHTQATARTWAGPGKFSSRRGHLRSSRRDSSVESSSSSSGHSVQSADESQTGSGVDVCFDQNFEGSGHATTPSEMVEEWKRNELISPSQGESMEEARHRLMAELQDHDRMNASMTTTYSSFARGDGQLHDWYDIPPIDTPDRVVFMFLVVNGLANEAWWADWFANADATGHKDHYSIVYHRGSAFGKDSDAISTDLLASKGIAVWPVTKTGWARNGLVRATLLLLRFALEGARNQWFVLLSDTCMPVYTFHDFYQILKRQNQSRFQDFGMTYDIVLQRNIWQPGVCTNERFSHKAAQWATWIRADAEWFVRENHLLKLKPMATFVDEPYFINMMEEFKRPYKDLGTTYTRWYKACGLTGIDPKDRVAGLKKFVASPHTFSKVDIKRILRARRRGCWFMRKVGPRGQYPTVEELEIASDTSCCLRFVRCLRAFLGQLVDKCHGFIFGPGGCFRFLASVLMIVCAYLTCGWIGEERRARRYAARSQRQQEQELGLKTAADRAPSVDSQGYVETW